MDTIYYFGIEIFIFINIIMGSMVHVLLKAKRVFYLMEKIKMKELKEMCDILENRKL